MAEFSGIVFNGIANPNFMKVKSISHSALPPISLSTIQIPGKAGSIDLNRNSIGDRKIDVEILIISPEKNMIPKQLELLAKWLYHEEAKELVLGDNPNRTYKAKLDGNTDFSEILRVGQGVISFTCTDPFIYGNKRDITLPDFSTQDYVSVINNGTAPTPPIVELQIKEQATVFGIVANNEFVEIGQSQTVDEEKPPFDPRVLYDPCRSLSGWTKSSGLIDATVTDQGFQVGTDGERFEPVSGKVDETDIDKWYGPSMQKQCLSDTQDFTSQINYYFTRSDDKEKNAHGKLVCVFKDKDNRDMACVRIYDNDANDNSVRVEFLLLNPGGTKTVVVRDVHFPREFHSIFGNFFVSRKGRTWEFRIDRVAGNTSTTVASGRYSDSSGEYMRPLKHFQIGFVRWKKQPVNYMSVSHVDIRSLDAPPSTNSDIEIIVVPGDKITINNETGKVYKNDGLWLKNINPSSTYLKFESGLNNMSVYPSGIINGGKITFQERYY